MMEELRQTLDLQLSQLNTIAGILRAEQQLLCAGSIDINKLHELTEQKNFVLTALGHTDQKRQILSKQVGIDRPYQGQPFLADLWGQLVDLTEELKHLNQHNGLLLEHILLAIVKRYIFYRKIIAQHFMVQMDKHSVQY